MHFHQDNGGTGGSPSPGSLAAVDFRLQPDVDPISNAARERLSRIQANDCTLAPRLLETSYLSRDEVCLSRAKTPDEARLSHPKSPKPFGTKRLVESALQNHGLRNDLLGLAHMCSPPPPLIGTDSTEEDHQPTDKPAPLNPHLPFVPEMSSKEAYDDIMNKIMSRDVKSRLMALHTLRFMGHEARTFRGVISTLTDDDDGEVRRLAYEVLAPMLAPDDVDFDLHQQLLDAIVEGDVTWIQQHLLDVDLLLKFVVWWRISKSTELWKIIGWSECYQGDEGTRFFKDEIDYHTDGSMTRYEFENAVRSGRIKSRPVGKSRQRAPCWDENFEKAIRLRSSAENVCFFRDCTWLILAVLVGQPNVVKLLLDHGVDYHAQYSSESGLARITWKGNACFAACISGNVEIMKLLLEHDPSLLQSRATLEGELGSGSDLVWEASYFGRHKMIEYLLSVGAPPEDVPVICKDNRNLRHTALHVAARRGSDNHLKIIKLLIAAGANMNVTSGEEIHCPSYHRLEHVTVSNTPPPCSLCGKTKSKSRMHTCRLCGFYKCEECYLCGVTNPLKTAIDLNHTKIVKYFVANDYLFPNWEDPDIWEDKLDALFRNPNSVTIAAVAEGLRYAREEQVRRLPRKCLVQFLESPGSASIHLMQAIFRKKHVRYLEEDETLGEVGTISSLTINTAYVRPKEVNVIEARGDFPNQLMRRQAKRDYHEALKYKLDCLEGKDQKQKWYNYFDRDLESRSQVDVYYCILPNIQRDVNVLFALCNAPTVEVFGVLGVEALANFLWGQVQSSQVVVTLFNLALITSFLVFTHTLNLTDESTASTSWTSVMGVVWVLSTLFELRECVCYIGAGKAFYYFSSMYNLLDLLVALSSGIVITVMVLKPSPKHISPGLRIAFSAVVFTRWIQFALSLRVYRGIGLQILPIFQAVFKTKAFMMLASILTVGFTHMYYVMHIHDIRPSLMTMFRLMWLGDFDTGDFEGVNTRYQITSPNEFEELDPDHAYDLHWYYARFCLLVVGFTFTVIMMNIYIAILTVLYEDCHEHARQSFNHARLCAVMQDFLWRYKLKLLLEGKNIAMPVIGNHHLWFVTRRDVEEEPEEEPAQSISTQSCETDCINAPGSCKDFQHCLVGLSRQQTASKVAQQSLAALEVKMTRMQQDQAAMLRILQEMQAKRRPESTEDCLIRHPSPRRLDDVPSWFLGQDVSSPSQKTAGMHGLNAAQAQKVAHTSPQQSPQLSTQRLQLGKAWYLWRAGAQSTMRFAFDTWASEREMNSLSRPRALSPMPKAAHLDKPPAASIRNGQVPEAQTAPVLGSPPGSPQPRTLSKAASQQLLSKEIGSTSTAPPSVGKALFEALEEVRESSQQKASSSSSSSILQEVAKAPILSPSPPPVHNQSAPKNASTALAGVKASALAPSPPPGLNRSLQPAPSKASSPDDSQAQKETPPTASNVAKSSGPTSTTEVPQALPKALPTPKPVANQPQATAQKASAKAALPSPSPAAKMAIEAPAKATPPLSSPVANQQTPAKTPLPSSSPEAKQSAVEAPAKVALPLSSPVLKQPQTALQTTTAKASLPVSSPVAKQPELEATAKAPVPPSSSAVANQPMLVATATAALLSSSPVAKQPELEATAKAPVPSSSPVAKQPVLEATATAPLLSSSPVANQTALEAPAKAALPPSATCDSIEEIMELNGD